MNTCPACNTPALPSLYATAVIETKRVREFSAYLYNHTLVVHTADYTDRGRELTTVITETCGDDLERAEYLQQYQCDRLASGMFGQVIGFKSELGADNYLAQQAQANGWQPVTV